MKWDRLTAKEARANLPDSPGIYRIYLLATERLPVVGQVAPAQCLYVGKAQSLKSRDVTTHFTEERTGSSSLRRTLGALLSAQLPMHALPRGKGGAPRDFVNYRFDTAGEHRLTVWMEQHLVLSAETVPPQQLRNIEKTEITKTRPLLNLTDWPSPHRKQLKALRKACADEARRSKAKPAKRVKRSSGTEPI